MHLFSTRDLNQRSLASSFSEPWVIDEQARKCGRWPDNGTFFTSQVHHETLSEDALAVGRAPWEVGGPNSSIYRLTQQPQRWRLRGAMPLWIPRLGRSAHAMLLSHLTCRRALVLPDVVESSPDHKPTSCTLGKKLVLQAYWSCIGGGMEG